MKHLLLLFTVFFMFSCTEKYVEMEHLLKNADYSIRAIQAINDTVVWASGTGGKVVLSRNGAESFKIFQVRDSLNVDFRGLWAFDDQTAIVMAVDNPALIFKTTDAGETWQEVYRKEQKGMFLNSISFKDDKNGVVLGDRLDGKFFMLHTTDGGNTWNEIDSPMGIDGEGCFAASNTCIDYLPNGDIYFVTGVKRAYVYSCNDKDFVWKEYLNPMPCVNTNGADGIYTIFTQTAQKGFIGGGNYLDVDAKIVTIAYTLDGGESWITPKTPTNTFVSCIKSFSKDDNSLLAVGSHSVSVSYNSGKDWHKVDSPYGFHAASASPNSNIIYLAGSKCRVSKIYLKEK